MSSIDPTGKVTMGNMMPGLVSGMDTESMVEKLLSGTQSKIDKQTQKKQQVEWKQEIYRDIITKLDNFRTQFFTYSGSSNTNLLSNSFYNVMSTVSSSSAVKVISSSSSAANSVKINKIISLAAARKEASANSVSQSLTGKIDLAKMAADKDGAEFKEYAVDISLDGAKKTIKFKGADTAAEVVSNINKSLSKVWGNTVKAEANASGDGFTVRTSDEATGVSTHRIVFSASKDSEGLSALGLFEGASNKMNYNNLLKEAPFKTALYGDSYEFTINGTKIQASDSDTIGDVINRINNSEAGVRVTYDSVTDKFMMESKLTGEVGGFTIEQTKGNLMSAMFGTASGSEMSVNLYGLTENKIHAANSVNGLDAIAEEIKNGTEKSFQFHIDGGRSVKVTIKPPEEADKASYDTQKMIEDINKQLDSAFGADNVKFELNAGQMSVSTQNGFRVSFDAEDADQEIVKAMGFADGQNQNIKPTSTMESLGLSGSIAVDAGTGSPVTISLDAAKTMQDVIDEYNAAGAGTMSLDPNTGELRIEGLAGKNISISGTDDAGRQAAKTLFGAESFTMNGTDTARTVVEAGKNAVLEVNGTTIERNSNEFDLDGVTIQLMDTSADAINLTTERDTDKIVDGIKKFVDEYNKIVDELNGYLTEKSNYRSYAPLTDAQKKEMTEKEIEKWEEKAKQGLLRNDSTIESLLGNMRSVMYKTVESAGMAMYDIGIEASGDYKDNGKLVLDESKLRSMLSTNMEKVQQLFTDKENGVGSQLAGILKDASNVSSASPGTLVIYAGAKTAMDTQNTLSKELKEISERIKTLNTQYEKERSRYWQQFTQMEQALSQLNTQSSWLSQQSSGSN